MTTYKKKRALTLYVFTLLSALFAGGSVVAEVPEIQGKTLFLLEWNKPFELTIEASNDPIGFGVHKLPFWIEREGARLFGNPLRKGSIDFSVFAFNEKGQSVPRKITLIVLDKVPEHPRTEAEFKAFFESSLSQAQKPKPSASNPAPFCSH